MSKVLSLQPDMADWVQGHLSSDSQTAGGSWKHKTLSFLCHDAMGILWETRNQIRAKRDLWDTWDY